MRKVYFALLWSDDADLFDGAPIHADMALAAAQHQLPPQVLAGPRAPCFVKRPRRDWRNSACCREAPATARERLFLRQQDWVS
jgi:hypothetical protein